MKYKVGDKVKVRSDLEAGCYHGIFVISDMVINRGKTVTIRKVLGSVYLIEEDNFIWKEELFEEQKNKFKVGQRVRIKRTGEIDEIKSVERGDYFEFGASSRCYVLSMGYFTVHDLEEVSEILDKTEKRYLKEVIKPFKNKIEYIKKGFFSSINQEYIIISLYESNTVLPPFDKGSMYKGMEIDEKYTLEELGLN